MVIAGGGLAGLTLACDLALRGVRAVVLDEDDTVGVKGASSRGICYAHKSLEICERLGIYERIREKGITWSEVNIEEDPQAAKFVESVNGGNQTVPTVKFPDGSALTNPSIKDVKATLGR